jgi:DNA-binding transcriptional LysR family regulator
MALNLKALMALRAVMTEGTVTAAAERLHRTQPVVSRLIAQIEAEVGFRLFRRERQRLIPTANGLAFYHEADRIFAAISEIEASARNIRERRAPPLRILAQSHIAHGLLHIALGKFATRHPDFHFSIEIRQREYATPWIANRQFDIGFVPQPVEHPQVLTESLFRAPLFVVLPKTHPLCDKRRLRVPDIATEPMITVRTGTPLRERLEIVFKTNDRKLFVRGETASALSACQLVERGVGITIADPFVVSLFLDNRTVVIRPLLPRIEIEYLVLRRLGDEPDPLIDEFVATVRATGRSLIDRVSKHAAA